jgi:hypothetical protein
MDTPRVLILGHSFVRRLRSDLQARFDERTRNGRNPHAWRGRANCPKIKEVWSGGNLQDTFVGIELNSIKSEARLPRDKIAKCVETIEAFLKRKKVRLQDFQSLIGLLNFATTV